MNIHSSIMFFFLLVAGSCHVNAGEIDAVVHMNKVLETKPSVTYMGEKIFWIDHPSGFMKIPIRLEEKYQGSAKVSNSYVAEVTALSFDKAKLVSLPEISLFAQKQLLNCADTSISSTVSLSVTGARSWGVSKTDGVTTTVSASASGSVGVPGVGSGSLSLGWNQAVSTSTTRQESFQDTTTRTMSDTVSIGPRKAANVSFLAYQSTIEIPFSATVVIDGDLVGSQGGPQKASALLSRTERTVPLNGTLRVTDVSEAMIRTDDLQGQAGCDGKPSILAIQELPQITFKSASTGSHLKSGFLLPIKAERVGNALRSKMRNFSRMSATDDGPGIGPPDGTSYEILYTSEVAKPTVGCGFNDLGVPNIGIFTVEARQYRTYVNGKLVAQYQDSVEVFKTCFNP